MRRIAFRKTTRHSYKYRMDSSSNGKYSESSIIISDEMTQFTRWAACISTSFEISNGYIGLIQFKISKFKFSKVGEEEASTDEEDESENKLTSV